MDTDDEGHWYLVIHNGLDGLSRPAMEYYLDTALRKAGKTRTKACLEDTCIYGTDMEDFLYDIFLIKTPSCEVLRKQNCEIRKVLCTGFYRDRLTDPERNPLSVKRYHPV